MNLLMIIVYIIVITSICYIALCIYHCITEAVKGAQPAVIEVTETEASLETRFITELAFEENFPV